MAEKTVQGFAVIPRWLLYSETLSSAAKITYAVLSSHVDATGSCWPSHATLARETSLSSSSVKRALAELKAAGIVSWETRQIDSGATSSNRYRLLVVAEFPEQADTPRSGRPTPQVTQTYPLGQGDLLTKAIEREPVNRRARRRSRPEPKPAEAFPESGPLQRW